MQYSYLSIPPHPETSFIPYASECRPFLLQGRALPPVSRSGELLQVLRDSPGIELRCEFSAACLKREVLKAQSAGSSNFRLESGDDVSSWRSLRSGRACTDHVLERLVGKSNPELC